MRNYISKFTYTIIFLAFMLAIKANAQTCTINLSSSTPFTFTSSGGNQSKTFTTSCSSPTITFLSVPSWLTISVSGNSIQVSCTANSTYRTASIAIQVNGSTVNGFSVNQGTPPPPPSCSLSGFSGGSFNSLGETISYPLSFSNCGTSSASFTFLTSSNQPLPNWISISQTGTSISVTTQPNTTSGNRTVVIIGSTTIGNDTYTIGGQISQNTCLQTWYLDADGDGYASSTQSSCSSPGTGYSTTVKPLGDCNDANASINPNTVWYKDADNDGFAASQINACSPGAGYTLTVLPLTDCDDTNNSINPNTVWYIDTDGDGYGDPTGNTITGCAQPNGYVLDNSDQCPTINSPSSDCSGYSNENYIFSRIYQKPMSSNSQITNSSDVIEQITYYDGLGRPKQNISIRAGGNSEDIVTPIEYDEFGRQTLEYLPYATNTMGGFIFPDAVNDVIPFYANNSKYENTANPYSEKELEESPLNRMLKQAAPGNDWALGNDHEIKFDYGSNIANEVRLYTVSLSSDYTPTLVSSNTNYYTAGQLNKTIIKDENWQSADGNDHTVEEFKDKEDRIVLKRNYNEGITHDTYYIYDKFGNLSYVIPPKVNTADGISTTELNELCYQYKYDSRNRLIEKKVPGKGVDNNDWEEIVYNKLDQPVLTRDPNLKAQNKWLFTKYDAYGRVAYTGIHNSASGRDALQAAANNTSNYEQFVAKTATPVTYASTDVYYDNAAIPQGMAEIHTISYYDNYTFDLAGLSIPTGSIYGQTIATGNQIKGLPTGNKVRVLGITEDKWIITITVYDVKGRAIYVASENEYLETIDIIQTEYDFSGKIVKTRTRHQKGSDDEIVTLDTFEYDHMGRLINQIQCIGDDSLLDDCNGGATQANPTYSSAISSTQNYVASNSITLSPGFHIVATGAVSFTAKIEAGGEQIVSNHYDELGQLDSKNVGGTVNGGGLQTVDYKYNIRGWLKQINDPNNLGNDLFGFKIGYNDKDFVTQYSYIPLYNGNISEAYWKTANDNIKRGYEYAYDDLNRLYIGQYGEGNNLTPLNNYTTVYNYDKNGNLTLLNRRGESGAFIDELDYVYNNSNFGNKLIKVTDASNNIEGFKDGANTTTEYTYDVNGNMKTDANKGITNITYNHLNLPTQVTINNGTDNGNITYIYDATGVKLKKIVSTGTTIEYAGNYVYENSSLKFFSTPEGYVQPVTLSGAEGYRYVYQYKDHLGNIRLSYSDSNGDGTITVSSDPMVTEIVEENNYYPFGLKHKGYNTNVSALGDHPYGFGGKEEQNELGLAWIDITARNYDASLGRWMNLDPLAELMRRHSPYNYAFDNPVYYIDPDGMAPLSPNDSENDSKDYRTMEVPFDDYLDIDLSDLFGARKVKKNAKTNDDGNDGNEEEKTSNFLLSVNEKIETTKGGPPYEYNGKTYDTKVELYGAIFLDQAAEQFGIKDIVALAAVIDNQGLINKPFQAPNASKGTSYASKKGAELFPQKMSKRRFTHFNKSGKKVYTKVLGRFLGRMAGPVGWAILAYDVSMTLYNTQVIYNEITE